MQTYAAPYAHPEETSVVPIDDFSQPKRTYGFLPGNTTLPPVRASEEGAPMRENSISIPRDSSTPSAGYFNTQQDIGNTGDAEVGYARVDKADDERPCESAWCLMHA
jgi:hypothetical protein